MKVDELIAILMKLPSKALVIKSRDEEGNGFEEVTEVESGYFSGEWEAGFSIALESPDQVTAVCLW